VAEPLELTEKVKSFSGSIERFGRATLAVASQTLGQACGLFMAGSPPSRCRSGRGRISALEERDSQQERRLAALEAKQSRLAQLPADLVRPPKSGRHCRSSGRPQRRLCGEIERPQSEVSGLQALAAVL
jgi:hypothetical protein